VNRHDCAQLLGRVDRYLHAAPLTGAEPSEIGAFTLFRSSIAWPYYARPRPGTGHRFTRRDIDELWAGCRELGLPLSVEWVPQCTPTLAGAVAAAGLVVIEHPLLVLPAPAFIPAAAPAGVTVEIIAADRQRLVTARAVADVAFGTPGTDVGPTGAQARDDRTAAVAAARGNTLLERARRGVTVTAVALGPDGRAVASGQHQPVDTSSEIVAVATLPAFRRRGLASAVTSRLAEHAFAGGADLVLLSAQNDDVARIYERLGFTRIGTVGAAEPLASAR
jgi:GNAT superfamily N-acetyltransferase